MEEIQLYKTIKKIRIEFDMSKHVSSKDLKTDYLITDIEFNDEEVNHLKRDHCWINGSTSKMKKIEAGNRYEAIAKAYLYLGSDGTKKLGFKELRFIEKIGE